jgi:deoxyribodipyrimidine photo-lyase
VLARVGAREGWSAELLPGSGAGARAGWWGMSESAEAFLDQLVTWRELGYHAAARRPDDYDRYEALPAWARATLEKHAGDARPALYAHDRLERGDTGDELWNAAQRQLRGEGRIHNYLRMLWGKRVLEWTPSPREALAALFALNDRWALDGRDPNSASGIGWCLGRYDRPWAPERVVYGVVRYMSSANTRRKLRLTGYLRRWSARPGPALAPAD